MAKLIEQPTQDNSKYIFFEASQMSGEICHTYYANKEGDLFKLCDWTGSKPEPVTQSELFKLGMQLFGLSPQLILWDFERWQTQ